MASTVYYGSPRQARIGAEETLPAKLDLIIDRLKALGRLEDYETLAPIKDWSTDRAGGPRRIVREDVQP